MRIRKNSRLVINGRSSSASLLICQLNRSPWDIDASSSQGEWGEGSFTRNGSMGDSSLYSGESMELSFEYMPPESKQESNKSLEEDEIGSLNNDGSSLKHPTLSDNYHSFTSNYRIPTTTTTKKKAAGGGTPPVPPPAPKRRGRPRKAVEGARTANRSKLINGVDGDNVSENDDVKNNMNKEDKGNKMKGYIENVMDEELDYIESEDDEEEMDGGIRRRVRKPIKARSLKSLM